MPRKATGKHMKKTGKDERSLQHQEEISERQNVPAIEDRPLEKAKEALPRSQATSKPPPTTAAPPKPASNTSAPAAPAATAPAAPRNAAKPHLRSSSGTRHELGTNTDCEPQPFEQQAVTTIGDWLLNKAKDAAPVAADLPEPAAVTTPADADAPASAHAATSEDEAMDATATSRGLRRHRCCAPCGSSAKEKENKRNARPKRRLPARVYETFAAEAPTAPRPHNSTVAVPRPCPGPLPAEDDFVTVVSKAAQAESQGTRGRGCCDRSYRAARCDGGACQPPSKHRGRGRVDAVVFVELLAIRELGGVPVTAREPADRRSSTGFVYGVDGDLTNAELLAGITSAVPVLSATREGASVKLRFAEPLPPERVVLFACGCGCDMRGRDHASASSSVASATLRGMSAQGSVHPLRPPTPGDGELQAPLRHCGGAHTADTPTCPRWQEERECATLIAATPTPLSRRAVKAAVREESREVRSYAAAVKNKLLEGNTTDPGLQRPSPRRADLSCQRRAPPGRACLLPTRCACRGPAGHSHHKPAGHTAGGDAIPSWEHPLRATCLQALGTRSGAPGASRLAPTRRHTSPRNPDIVGHG
ncbi:hypothetical protein HPB52_019396 [Rhipicephalus sanguineus]|uniref:Uncharacterized protein n=1 Tax=Rhipicephalus sanguineus TaxID=34632 RepID=A0A9D4SZI4_RHISA|nr:hypothetical protein HPB52_019396 [Rhipicephalus sanguineus]